jgi:hypothetical protein
VVDAGSSNADVVLQLGRPGAGTHVLTLQPGELIELVVQVRQAGRGWVTDAAEYTSAAGIACIAAGAWSPHSLSTTLCFEIEHALVMQLTPQPPATPTTLCYISARMIVLGCMVGSTLLGMQQTP